jgi:hypothetical protein
MIARLIAPNTACTQSPEERQSHGGETVRVFKQFIWLGVGSGKMSWSRPAGSSLSRSPAGTLTGANANASRWLASSQYVDALRIVM